MIALGNFSTYFLAYKEENVYHFNIPWIKIFTIYGQLSLSTRYLDCLSLSHHAIAALCKQGRVKKKIYSHIKYLDVWLMQINLNTQVKLCCSQFDEGLRNRHHTISRLKKKKMKPQRGGGL